MSNSPSATDPKLELEWVELKEAMTVGRTVAEMSSIERFLSKVKENPLVPIGMAATTFCLGYGLYNLKKGDHHKQQLMMRGRVIAQGFTVFAIVGSLMASLANKAKKSANAPDVQ